VITFLASDVWIVSSQLGNEVVPGDAEVSPAGRNLLHYVSSALEQHLDPINTRQSADVLPGIGAPDTEPGTFQEAEGRFLISTF